MLFFCCSASRRCGLPTCPSSRRCGATCAHVSGNLEQSPQMPWPRNQFTADLTARHSSRAWSWPPRTCMFPLLTCTVFQFVGLADFYFMVLIMWGFATAFHIALRRDQDAQEVGLPHSRPPATPQLALWRGWRVQGRQSGPSCFKPVCLPTHPTPLWCSNTRTSSPRCSTCLSTRRVCRPVAGCSAGSPGAGRHHH